MFSNVKLSKMSAMWHFAFVVVITGMLIMFTGCGKDDEPQTTTCTAANCVTCVDGSTTKCKSCHTGFSVSNDVCVRNAETNCDAANCNKCVAGSTSECASDGCKAGYTYQSSDKTCKQNAEPLCPANCDKCGTSTTKCDAGGCKTGFYEENGSCKEILCKADPAIANCATCSDDITKCDGCIAGYKLDGLGGCVSNDITCSDDCMMCSSTAQCNKCSSGCLQSTTAAQLAANWVDGTVCSHTKLALNNGTCAPCDPLMCQNAAGSCENGNPDGSTGKCPDASCTVENCATCSSAAGKGCLETGCEIGFCGVVDADNVGSCQAISTSNFASNEGGKEGACIPCDSPKCFNTETNLCVSVTADTTRDVATGKCAPAF